MKQEGEISEEIEAARFRDQMFLHSVANQNPKLYFELYDDPDEPDEWEVPQSPEDLQRMMAELAEVGVNLNAPPEPPPSQEDHYEVRQATQPWNRV